MTKPITPAEVVSNYNFNVDYIVNQINSLLMHSSITNDGKIYCEIHLSTIKTKIPIKILVEKLKEVYKDWGVHHIRISTFDQINDRYDVDGISFTSKERIV